MPGYDAQMLTLLLGFVVVASPAALVLILGVPSLLDWKLSERTVGKAAQAVILTGLTASVGMLAVMLFPTAPPHEAIPLGDWVDAPRFHFAIKFVFDRLSVPFAILTFVLSGAIAAFATRYLHRERGFNRFFMLYALFLLGMIVTS